MKRLRAVLWTAVVVAVAIPLLLQFTRSSSETPPAISSAVPPVEPLPRSVEIDAVEFDAAESDPGVADSQTERVVVMTNPEADVASESDDNEEERDVVVRVVDTDGQPVAGVRVLLMVETTYRPGEMHPSLESEPSDSNGLAVLDLRGHRESFKAAPFDIVSAMLVAKYPAAVRPSVELEGLPDAGSTHALTIPTTSSLSVTFLLPDGTPAVGKASVQARWSRGVEDPEGQDETFIWFYDDDGTVELAPLQPGLNLSLQGNVKELDREGAYGVAVLAPRAGETASIELALGARYPRYRLRLLAPTGEPVVSESVGVTTISAKKDAPEGGRTYRGGFKLRTDDSGVAERAETGSQHDDWNYTWRIDPPTTRANEWAPIEITAPSPGASGEVVELEDLRYDVAQHSERLLVAGRTLTAEGEPVSPDAWSLTLTDDRGQRRVLADRSDYTIERIPMDGRFAITGAVEDGRLTIHASKRGYSGGYASGVELGTEGLRLEYTKLARLTAQLLVDEETVSARLIFNIGSRSPDVWGTGVALDLAPGTYDFVVETRNPSLELVRVEGVDVRDGAGPDPRLAPLDLRGLARTVQVTLRGVDGTPLVDHFVWYTSEGAGAGSDRTSKKGTLSLHVPTALERIQLAPDGYEAQVLSLANETAELTFSLRDE